MTIIYTPYRLEGFEKILANKYLHNWDSSDLQPVRNNVRDHLHTIFNERCFYCKCKLEKDCSHIEHIVHKAKYKFFTYNPMNLTYACRKCNETKSDGETLIHGKRSMSFISIDDYPANENDYQIIHAYLDNYDDYISVTRYIFYKIKYNPNDLLEKAKNTIELCGLSRFMLAEKNIKQARGNSIISPITKLISLKGKLFTDLKGSIKEMISEKKSFEAILELSNQTNFIKHIECLEKNYIEVFEYLKDIRLSKFESFYETNIDNLENTVNFVEYVNTRSNLLIQIKSLPSADSYNLLNGKVGLNFSGINGLINLRNNLRYSIMKKQMGDYSQKTFLSDNIREQFLLNRIDYLEICAYLYEMFKDPNIIDILIHFKENLSFYVNEINRIDTTYEEHNRVFLVLKSYEELYNRVLIKYNKERLYNLKNLLEKSLDWFS